MKDLKFVSGAVWTLRAARLVMRPPGRAARVPEGVLTPSPTTATASASSAPPVGSPLSPHSKGASVPRHQPQEDHRQVSSILTYLWHSSLISQLRFPKVRKDTRLIMTSYLIYTSHLPVVPKGFLQKKTSLHYLLIITTIDMGENLPKPQKSIYQKSENMWSFQMPPSN